jgi:hypothetical protein
MFTMAKVRIGARGKSLQFGESNFDAFSVGRSQSFLASDQRHHGCGFRLARGKNSSITLQ